MYIISYETVIFFTSMNKPILYQFFNFLSNMIFTFKNICIFAVLKKNGLLNIIWGLLMLFEPL